MNRLPLTRTELEIRIKKYPSNKKQYGDIKTWNVSNITDMSNLFMYSNSFNEDISGWDVSKVTNMSGMFEGATSFNQPLNKWDVSKVTNMSGMFDGATSFNQPLNKWDVSKVTEMSFMFYNAESFNQPLYNWNIKKVRNLTRFTNTRQYHETGRAHVKEGKILLGPHFKYININPDFNGAYNLWLKQLFIMLLYQMKLNVKNTKLNNIDNIDNSTKFDNVKNITIEECLTLPENLNILNILLPYIECFSTGPTMDKIPNGLKNFLYYVEDIHYFHDNDIEMPDGFNMVNSKEGFELIKKDLENIKQYNNEIIGAEKVAKKIYSKFGQDMYNNIVHFIPGTQPNKFYTINYESTMDNLGHNSESISNTQIQPIIPNTQPAQRNSRLTAQPTRRNSTSTTQQSTRRNTTSTTQPPARRNTTSTTQQSTRRNTTSTTLQPARRNSTSTTQQPTRRNSTSTTQQPTRRNTTSTTQQPTRRNTTSTTQQPTRRNTRERNNRILQNNWIERISEPNQPRERDEYEIGEDGYEIGDE